MKRGIADLDAAIILQPHNADFFLRRAAAYAESDDTEKAIRYYADAIRLAPEASEPYLRRGELHRTTRALDKALGDFDEAIKRAPRDTNALLMRALTREDVEQRDGAIDDYRSVLQVDPKNSLARTSLTRLGSAPVRDTGPPTIAKEGKTASLQAPPVQQPLARSIIGRWYGEIKGLNDSRFGDFRTLIITSVSPNGTVVGRWAGGSGTGGEGTGFALSANALVVTTTYGNHVTLRHSGGDKLVGTFTVRKTGKQHFVQLAKQ
jgi:tetratricopeptide (TPR) repeat protein